MALYEVYIDDSYVGTYDLDIGDSYYYGDDGTSVRVWPLLLSFSIHLVSVLMAVICPAIFFGLMLPGAENIGAALLDSAHLAVLWVVSVLSVILLIKRKIFMHKLENSTEPKYENLRRQLYSTPEESTATTPAQNGDSEESPERLFIKETATPIRHALSTLRRLLLAAFVVLAAIKLIAPALALNEAAFVIVGPLFAYTYIFSILNEYLTYGKDAHAYWLFLVIAVIVGYLLMLIPGLETVAEYVILGLITLLHELASHFMYKSN